MLLAAAAAVVDARGSGGRSDKKCRRSRGPPHATGSVPGFVLLRLELAGRPMALRSESASYSVAAPAPPMHVLSRATLLTLAPPSRPRRSLGPATCPCLPYRVSFAAFCSPRGLDKHRKPRRTRSRTSIKRRKEDKVWPTQAIKIDSVVGLRGRVCPSTSTGSADSNPHALPSADRREEVGSWRGVRRRVGIRRDRKRSRAVRSRYAIGHDHSTPPRAPRRIIEERRGRIATTDLALNEAGLAR